MRTTLVLAALALCITSACSYKVLCMFAAPARSSDHLGHGFVRTLLKAGHQVKWATPFPEKKASHANLTIIDLTGTRRLTKAFMNHIEMTASNCSSTSARCSSGESAAARDTLRAYTLMKDLQDLLDNSNKGFIYFSMGSVVQSAGLPESTRAGLLRIFAKLPYSVLWMFEEPLKDLPANVHVRPWLPQPSVLAHSNLRLFITHGGQLSSLEAIHAGVPMLAVPIFGDQPANAERARKLGYALKVDFHKNFVEDLEETLNEMLGNDTFYKRAKHLSKIFHARPTTPSQLIPYAVELAIETKGAFHLLSQALNYSWLLWMLDFVLLLTTKLTLVMLLFRFIMKLCIRKCRGSTTNIVKKNN